MAEIESIGEVRLLEENIKKRVWGSRQPSHLNALIIIG